MFSKYLSSIDGVAIFPIISLLIFFTVFVGFLVWTFRIKKSYLREMENLPLLDEEINNKGFNSNE